MENRYQIRYDMKSKYITPVYFKQGDVDSSVLEVELLDNGLVVDITGESIEFRFQKPDNTIVYQDVSSGVTLTNPTSGIVECVLHTQTLSSVGRVICEIHRSKDGKQLTTASFLFTVEKSIEPTTVESLNYISSLESLITDIENVEEARAVFEAYNNSHSYVIGNKVSYLGSSYTCILASTGNLPTNSTYWLMIASKGDIGKTGVAAGFGTPVISATTLPAGSQATATVTASGADTAKVFNIALGLPRGDTGLNGAGTGDMLAADYVKGTGKENTNKVDHASYAETVEPNYLLQVPYAGATSGTANTYTIATPTITALTAGLAICVKINVNSTASSTLNWCSLGAKSIKKANGASVTNLKAGGIYTMRYDGTNFILQGEGASGTAVASDLLSGKTASSDAGDITGTMKNNGAVTITPSTSDQTIAAGYHNGSGKVVGDADLIATNILSGVNIFGVAGSLAVGKRTASGTTTSSSYVATVTGLSFRPGLVVLVVTDNYNYGIVGASSSVITNGTHHYYAASNAGDSTFTPNASGFTITLPDPTKTLYWRAYEE